MSPQVEGETGTHLNYQWKEGGKGGEKTMHTVNTIAVKAANTSNTCSPGACTYMYQNTADNYRNPGALCC